jgi:hypothetical protein
VSATTLRRDRWRSSRVKGAPRPGFETMSLSAPRHTRLATFTYLPLHPV